MERELWALSYFMNVGVGKRYAASKWSGLTNGARLHALFRANNRQRRALGVHGYAYYYARGLVQDSDRRAKLILVGQNNPAPDGVLFTSGAVPRVAFAHVCLFALKATSAAIMYLSWEVSDWWAEKFAPCLHLHQVNQLDVHKLIPEFGQTWAFFR